MTKRICKQPELSCSIEHPRYPEKKCHYYKDHGGYHETPESSYVVKTLKWGIPDIDDLGYNSLKSDISEKEQTTMKKESVEPSAVLECKKLTPTAKLPAKTHTEDAAWDLFADIDQQRPIVIESGKTVVVLTGLAIKPPVGWSCDIRGRSGMNSKGKFVVLGLVDAGYEGSWGVILHNATGDSITINHHDKIAQFTVNKVYSSEIKVVEEFASSSIRGTSGFGSTGTK